MSGSSVDPREALRSTLPAGGSLVVVFVPGPVLIFSYVAEDVFTTGALAMLARTLRRPGREANQGEVGIVTSPSGRTMSRVQSRPVASPFR